MSLGINSAHNWMLSAPGLGLHSEPSAQPVDATAAPTAPVDMAGTYSGGQTSTSPAPVMPDMATQTGDMMSSIMSLFLMMMQMMMQLLGGQGGSGALPGGGSAGSGSASPAVAGQSQGLSVPPSGGAQGGVIGWAQSHLGKNEGDSDWMNYVTNGQPNLPWCAFFVTKAFEENGGAPWGAAGSSVQGILDWGRENGRFLDKSQMPQPGDVMIEKEGNKSHTGIVTRVEDLGGGRYKFYTIEGNTSDSVGERDYTSDSPTLTGFVRP